MTRAQEYEIVSYSFEEIKKEIQDKDDEMHPLHWQTIELEEAL